MRDPLTGSLQELDECSLMQGICQHGTCTNTVGSYRCDCHTGYTFDQVKFYSRVLISQFNF